MKTNALIIAFICLSNLIFAKNIVQEDELKFKLKKISEKILIIETEHGSASQLVIVSKMGLVFFGSHFSNSMAKDYINFLKEEIDRDDIIYLINNSGRIIKSGGNVAFKNATIISTDKTYNEMNREKNELDLEIEKSISGWKWKAKIAQEQLAKLDSLSPQIGLFREWVVYCNRVVNDLSNEEYKLILPDLVYSDNITFYLDDISLSMNKFGFTFIAEEGVLFASNFFHPIHFSNYFKFKSVEEEVDVPGILKMLEEVFSNNNQIKTVYSGFSGTMPLSDIQNRISYYNQLWIDIINALQGNKSFDETSNTFSLDNKYSWIKTWEMFKNNPEMTIEEHENNIKLFWNAGKKL